MAAQSFIKASAAAVIGGVTVAQLGCSSGDEFPTKGGLIDSGGAFDASRLENYDDDDFVLENDVVLGQSLVELQMNGDVYERGNVQLDNGSLAPSVAVICVQGDTVTAKCILDDASDLVLGWYDEDDELVSTDQNYAFTVNGDINLTAKVAYMDINKSALQFGYNAASNQIYIESNIGWSIT